MSTDANNSLEMQCAKKTLLNGSIVTKKDEYVQNGGLESFQPVNAMNQYHKHMSDAK
jgi:hypothetical protein